MSECCTATSGRTKAESSNQQLAILDPYTVGSLFFPRAAFPLLNGSVILLADNVFATYDFRRNEPTMLNDKSIFFPNLPDNLRAGILQAPGSERSYYMMTPDEVYVYDTWMRKSIISVRLQEFLTCDSRWE